jgi:hypothetical protein
VSSKPLSGKAGFEVVISFGFKEILQFDSKLSATVD